MAVRGIDGLRGMAGMLNRMTGMVICMMGGASTQCEAENEAGPTEIGSLSWRMMREDRENEQQAGVKQQIR